MDGDADEAESKRNVGDKEAIKLSAKRLLGIDWRVDSVTRNPENLTNQGQK